MRNWITHNILKVIAVVLAAVATISCELIEFGSGTPDQYNKVMLLYSAGYNNLFQLSEGRHRRT